MTDTRLPESWLTNAVIDALSSDALRVHFLGLMWSNANGTDGLLPDRALRYLHPDGKRLDCLEELTAAGLWQQETGGHRVIGFLDSQTPADEMEEKRKINRERQRQYRQRQRDEQHRQLADSPTSQSHDVTPPTSQSHDVTRDVTHDVRRYVGQVQEKEQEQANNGTKPTAKVARVREPNPGLELTPYLRKWAASRGWPDDGSLDQTLTDWGPLTEAQWCQRLREATEPAYATEESA